MPTNNESYSVSHADIWSSISPRFQRFSSVVQRQKEIKTLLCLSWAFVIKQ